MKKLIRFMAAFLLVATMLASLAACTTPGEVEITTAEPEAEQTTQNPEETTLAPECAHSYTESVTVPVKVLSDGEKTFTCEKCGGSYKEAIPATKSVKILAIGNSFSVDAMEYLWDIARAGGAENVTLGNMYIGGCALAKHAANIKSNSAAYTYYKNTSGKWNSTANVSIKTALEDEEWDIITIQQASGNSGIASTYKDLDTILPYLKENEPNAQLYWHMTWAYQQNSTHSDFAKYQNDQTKMYNNIIGSVKQQVVSRTDFVGIIPSGTSIQNLRSSYLGDTITRDGYHMSYDVGRYTAAMTWFAYVFGGDVDKIEWTPAQYSAQVTPHIPAIREAVKGAMAKPFEVTEVKAEKPETPAPQTDADLFASIGKNIDDYVELDWVREVCAYYNSNNKFEIYNSVTSTASNVPNFIASYQYKKENLPVGSVVIVDSGYQYRPEGWVDQYSTNNSSTRPGNTSAPVFEITEEWWSKFTIRAFNLSAQSARKMTEDDIKHLRIYLPKSANAVPVNPDGGDNKPSVNTDDAIAFANAQLDINNYELIDLGPMVHAYYNSTKGIEIFNAQNSTASNIPNFIGTKLFTKEDLPNGTVIIVDSGYQYRPEGWVDENYIAASSSKRPGNTTNPFIQITDDWWGDFTIRGFNISATTTRVMTEDDIPHFRIYVPKK